MLVRAIYHGIEFLHLSRLGIKTTFHTYVQDACDQDNTQRVNNFYTSPILYMLSARLNLSMRFFSIQFFIMIHDSIFRFNRKLLSFLLSFSGFDLFAVYKYNSTNYCNHPKIARYRIEAQRMDETKLNTLSPKIRLILYCWYTLYLLNFIIIPIGLIQRQREYGQLCYELECSNPRSNLFQEKSYFPDFIRNYFHDYSSRIAANPELFALNLGIFLQAILGRLFCAGHKRFPDLSEIRSLFDRDRELSRLEQSISSRLTWFKTSIEFYIAQLDEQAKYNCALEDSDQRYYENYAIIKSHLKHVQMLIQNPQLMLPKEFNEKSWTKLKLMFTKTVLSIVTTYLIAVSLGHCVVFILYRRVRCKMLLDCLGEAALTGQDQIELVAFLLFCDHMIITHSAFPIIFTMLQYCHDEMINGWTNLIDGTIERIDQMSTGRSSKEIDYQVASLDALISSSIYQIEVERLNYALSICLELPWFSAILSPIVVLVMLPSKSVTVGIELGMMVFCGCWITSNIYGIQCSMAAAKVDRIEKRTWMLVAKNVAYKFERAKTSVHLYEDIGSMLWRRMAITWQRHGRFFYSPHPFGLDIGFDLVLQINFYIMSVILLVEKFVEMSKAGQN